MIAEIGDTGFRIARNNDRICDVGAAVTLEMPDHRQFIEIDVLALIDLFHYRAVGNIFRLDRSVGAFLILAMKLTDTRSENTGDPFARREHIRDQRHLAARNLIADQHGRLAFFGQRGHQSGDIATIL